MMDKTKYISSIISKYMSLAGWEVRIVKNCDEVLKMLPDDVGQG